MEYQQAIYLIFTHGFFVYCLYLIFIKTLFKKQEIYPEKITTYFGKK